MKPQGLQMRLVTGYPRNVRWSKGRLLVPPHNGQIDMVSDIGNGLYSRGARVVAGVRAVFARLNRSPHLPPLAFAEIFVTHFGIDPSQIRLSLEECQDILPGEGFAA